MNTDPQPW